MVKKLNLRILAIVMEMGMFCLGCGDDGPAVHRPLQLFDSLETRLIDSFKEKIARYPEPDGLGLAQTTQRWMGQTGLKEGLVLIEDRIQSRPIIALLDSGVDFQHRALKDALFQKPSNLHTRCKNDLRGCNTSNFAVGQESLGDGSIFPIGTNGPSEACTNKDYGVCGHGSHVAGVIAGYSVEQQIFGVCPFCRILPIKVALIDGSIPDQAIIGAFEYIYSLKKQGVPIKVVNASFGKGLHSERIAALLESVPELKDDLLIIAAAGNENSDMRSYPAAFQNVIAVANVASADLVKDSTSNFGAWVDISAPVGECYLTVSGRGFGIVSSLPGDETSCFNGTSIAAPIVSGLAGLLLAIDPEMDVSSLRNRILKGADGEKLYTANPSFLLQQEGGRVPLLGSGVVDIPSTLRGETKWFSRRESQRSLENSSCGTVGASEGNANGHFLIFVFLFFPVVFFGGVRGWIFYIRADNNAQL